MRYENRPDHGWRGGGRFRVARLDGRLILHFTAASSSAGRLKADIGDFFRKDYREIKADFRPYAVRVWLRAPGKPRLDVDNVAKACLDALTGVIWKDDSQVVALDVRKCKGESDDVTLVCTPAETPTESVELSDTLALAARAS